MAYPSKRSLNKKSCGALVDLGVWMGRCFETVSKAFDYTLRRVEGLVKKKRSRKPYSQVPA
jgi:hypothetical protein